MSPFRGPDQTDDLRLARALKSGQSYALNDLNAAYGPWLYDYAYALLRDRDWAADALYETLRTVRSRAATAPAPERLRGWLYGVLRDECLARLADPEAQPADPQEADDAVAAEATDLLRLESRRRTVVAALAGLTGREREIADLTLRHGLGAVELAEVLGITARAAADQAVATHEEIARALGAELGRPVGTDRLPGVLAVLPFAAAPAELAVRVASEAAVLPAAPMREASDEGGPEKARVWPALVAAGTVVLLVGLVYLALPGGSKNSSATLPQAGGSTATTATVPTDGTTASSPDPTSPSVTPRPALPPAGGPAPGYPSQHTGGHTPSRTPTGKSKPPAGSDLTVDDSGCRYVTALVGPASCSVTLTAKSALHWAVVSGSSNASGTVSATGSGDLVKGASAKVNVKITPSSGCNGDGGGGSGTVTFSPTAQATVTFLC